MPLMSGGDAVVRSILGHGVSSIYCLPGVQSDHLFNAMFDVGDALQVVHTRHEQGAAYMALGRVARDRQARGLFGGAGAGLSQQHGRTRHRLFDRCARARADRADPEPRHRQRSRIAARDPRPDRHPAQADQMDRAHGAAAGRARGWSAQAFRAVALRAPAAGRDSSCRPTFSRAKAEVELLPPLASDPERAARRRRDRARGRAAGEGRMSGDLCRRRRARSGRRGARAGRAAERAGRRLSPRQGHSRRASSAQPRAAGRARALGQGRRGAGGGDAPANPGLGLGDRRQAQDHQDRHRPGRDRPLAQTGDRPGRTLQLRCCGGSPSISRICRRCGRNAWRRAAR